MSALIGAASSVAKGVTGLIRGGAVDRKETTLAVLQSAESRDNAQARINEKEAGHSSVFVAGWRPSVGWSCSIGFSLSILAHVAPAFLILGGHELTEVQLTQLDNIYESLNKLITPTLATLLGYGGLRSFEKVMGAARQSLKSDRSIRKELKTEAEVKEDAKKEAKKLKRKKAKIILKMLKGLEKRKKKGTLIDDSWFDKKSWEEIPSGIIKTCLINYYGGYEELYEMDNEGLEINDWLEDFAERLKERLIQRSKRKGV